MYYKTYYNLYYKAPKLTLFTEHMTGVVMNKTNGEQALSIVGTALGQRLDMIREVQIQGHADIANYDAAEPPFRLN